MAWSGCFLRRTSSTPLSTSWSVNDYRLSAFSRVTSSTGSRPVSRHSEPVHSRSIRMYPSQVGSKLNFRAVPSTPRQRTSNAGPVIRRGSGRSTVGPCRHTNTRTGAFSRSVLLRNGQGSRSRIRTCLLSPRKAMLGCSSTRALFISQRPEEHRLPTYTV